MVSPQVDKVDKVPQGVLGVQGAKDSQVPRQGDPILNVEGAIGVP